jgi:hypothetical protein
VEKGVADEVWLMVTWNDAEPFEDLAGTLKVAEQYNGFFKVFGFLDYLKPPEHINELFEMGCVGLKSILPQKPYDDEAYYAHYHIAESLGMPILFHTGVISNPQCIPKNAKRGHTNMKPSMLTTICCEFPKLNVINAHPGFPWTEEVLGNLRYQKNYYVDISSGHSLPYLKSWVWDFFEGKAPDGRPFTQKILAAVDGLTGDEEGNKISDDTLTFWKLFFEYVGRGASWGEDGIAVMDGNAKRLLENTSTTL